MSTCSQHPCPLCGQLAWRVHSQYGRIVADVPCGGRRVVLTLTVRKFHRQTPNCPRKIFAERFPGFLKAFARMTNRLQEALLSLGFATCGKAVARLAPHIGMGVTPTTLLRHMHALALPPIVSVSHIGIDDFAWKKGRRYGTILVNLLTHQVIDLLPDRTVHAWLAAHPEIEAGRAAVGGGRMPMAHGRGLHKPQMADKWHIIRNFGDAIERFIMRERIQIPSKIPDTPTVLAQEPVLDLPALIVADSKVFAPASAQWQERYQQVCKPHAQGKSLHAIAKQLRLARNTIR